MSDDDMTIREQLKAAVGSGQPFGPKDGGAKLDVRAAELRGVLLEGEKTGRAVLDRLWLRNLRVVGDLDLQATELQIRLLCEHCELGSISLQQAKVPEIRFEHCFVEGSLDAWQLTSEWNFMLTQSDVRGGITLQDARIDGSLFLTGSRVASLPATTGGRFALVCDGIDVRGSVMCDGHFRASGESRFVGARIQGQLVLTDAELDGRGAAALKADRIEAREGISLSRVSAEGEVRIPGSVVGGELFLSGASLKASHDTEKPWVALHAERARIAGSFVGLELVAEGEIRLIGAKVGGQLRIIDSRLVGQETPDGLSPAFTGDGLRVEADIFMVRVEATGEIRLIGARVGGMVSIAESSLGAVDSGVGAGHAVAADRIEVGEVFHFTDGTATGEIRLVGASIAGQLAFSNLTASSATLVCIDITGAKADELELSKVDSQGVVCLAQAQVRTLWDANGTEFSGDPPVLLDLSGFQYETLRVPLSAEERLRWIASSQHLGFVPGAYAELARAFRRMGHDGDARKVAVAGEREARGQYSWYHPRRALNFFLWVTIGYGYRNWQALWWLFFLLAIGTIAFYISGEEAFTPLQKESLLPTFNPFLYAVDVTVPVIEVGQQKARATSGWLTWLSFALTVGGYALATAVIAAVAGLLSRDQKT